MSFAIKNPSPAMSKSITGALVVVLGAVSMFATAHMMFATAAYIFMVSGLLNLSNKKKHAILMSCAMIMDLLLVLKLQFQKQAIQTALALSLTPLQQMHVYVSTLATVLYFPMFYLGFRNIKDIATAPEKVWHKKLGLLTFALRTLGFFLMFSMLNRPH